MRPRELTLHGFRSYADPTTISWEDRQLVGIVGPIGSGKSSILDGISFALYGKTPRLGTETVGLINQRRNEGKVSLTFSVGDSVWKVVRALRRKGPSAHALYRVEDGKDIEVSDKAREVTDKVEELLGLDYEGFSRSILLAQGQFAQFLDATSVERDKVLKGVFGFERIDAMREIAKSKRDQAGAGLKALERLREQAEEDRKTLETVTTAAEAATGLVGKLESALEPVAAADTEIAAAVASAIAAVAERDALTALAERIPGRSETDELLGAVEGASQAVGEAEAVAQAAAEAEVAARSVLDEAIAATGGREALAAARALLARHTEQTMAASRAESQTKQAVEDAASGEVAATEAATAAEVAEKARKENAAAVAAAAKEAERLASALHEAQHRDLASTLRRDLADGDLCPVCEQTIAEVPSAVATGLDEATTAHQAALASLAALRGEDATLVRDAASLKASAEAAATVAQRLVAASAAATELATGTDAAAIATTAELTALLGETDDPAAELERRAAILSETETAWEASRAATASASKTVQAARTAAEGSGTRLDGLRTTLAGLSERLGEVDLSGGPEVLGAALQQLREKWVARNTEIESSLEGIEARRVAGTESRAAALAGVGLAAEADLAAAIAAAREQKASLEGRLADLAKRLEDLTRLEKEQADLVTQHDLYQRLVDDLLPSNFQKYLLDDRRRALAALGSERFEFLSAGRYRFTDDEKFEVIDLTAADLTRKAASLSGGETFLASLALALALAEIVAREGGRLDAFFLDEGFGSLDDEHVGLAMDGIERLVLEGQDRLIVVVSHVAGLRDRLEDLIVLAKDEVTGDTTLRSGASVAG